MGWGEKNNPNSTWYKKRHPKISVSGGSIAVSNDSIFHAIKRFFQCFIHWIIKKWTA
jgi:hypothetical protein